METVASAKPATKGVSPRKKWSFRQFLPTSADMFVLPYVLFLLAFGILPGLFALILSFANFSTGTPQYFAAGLHNYQTAIHDFRFLPAFSNVLQFLIISVPFGVILVVFIALLLHARDGWYGNAMRTVYFLPGAIAGPTAVMLTLFLLDPSISPLRGFFDTMQWTSIIQVVQPAHLIPVFTLMGFTVGAGGWIAILYGGLKGIPKDVIESALIDGANSWQIALHVKLPMIWKYIVYFTLSIFALNVQIFTEPQILSINFSFAGIATVSPTWSPNQLAYFFAFNNGDFGAAAAIALMMVAIGLAGSLIIINSTGFFNTEAVSD